jgi:hypothetical protein
MYAPLNSIATPFSLRIQVRDWESQFLRDHFNPSLPRSQFVQLALLAHRQLPAKQAPYLEYVFKPFNLI